MRTYVRACNGIRFSTQIYQWGKSAKKTRSDHTRFEMDQRSINSPKESKIQRKRRKCGCQIREYGYIQFHILSYTLWRTKDTLKSGIEDWSLYAAKFWLWRQKSKFHRRSAGDDHHEEKEEEEKNPSSFSFINQCNDIQVSCTRSLTNHLPDSNASKQAPKFHLALLCLIRRYHHFANHLREGAYFYYIAGLTHNFVTCWMIMAFS